MQNAAAIGTGHEADALTNGQGQQEPANHGDPWVPLQSMPVLLCSHFPNLSCHVVMKSVFF